MSCHISPQFRPDPVGAINLTEIQLQRVGERNYMGQKVWERKSKKEKSRSQKGTEGCSAPHSASSGPSAEARRMKQGVFAAKVDTCLLYWCPAYMWVARGARTNAPSLHPTRKWSLGLHSLFSWVTRWETQARLSAWTSSARYHWVSRNAKSLLSHRWLQCIWSMKCWLGSPFQPGRGFTCKPLIWEPFCLWEVVEIAGFYFSSLFWNISLMFALLFCIYAFIYYIFLSMQLHVSLVCEMHRKGLLYLQGFRR